MMQLLFGGTLILGRTGTGFPRQGHRLGEAVLRRRSSSGTCTWRSSPS